MTSPATHNSIDYGTRIWSGFVLALASLILVGAGGIGSIRSLINRDRWVNQSRNVIESLSDLRSSAKSLQGDMLAYAMSGDENFMRRSRIESEALASEIDRIRNLVADNPDQRRRLSDMVVLVDARRELAKKTAAAAAGGFPKAAAIVRQGLGLDLTDAITRQVAEMTAVENALLAARDVAAEAAGERSLAVIAFGSLFSVLFVGLAGVFIGRSLAALRLRNLELAHNEQQMRRLNEELGAERAAADQRSHELGASEEALQRQTDLLQAILDGMSEGVLARGSDGRLLLSNRAARGILPGRSFSPESTFATFTADYEIFLDEFGTPAPLAELPMARAMSGIQIERAELYLRRYRTGEKLCLEVSARPLRDRRGAPFGVMTVFRDISERKRAEREQARLAAVVQSSSDAIMSGTPDGVIATFNLGAEQLYGYKAEEAIGRNLSILEPPDKAGEINRMVRQSLDRHGSVRYETRRIRKDGGIFDADVIHSPIYDQSGREIGVSSIVRDITQRKRAERDLDERTHELERSNAELEQFAYLASHDLQEPLRMVGSYVQLLRDRYRGRLDSDADDFIDFAVDGVVRMKRLINDLLVYSRAGRGQSMAPVESGEALDWATANLALRLSESGATVTRGEMPPVMADASQLGQLFQNLIDNALKFRGEAPPRIEVRAERRGAFWEFCVLDNGIGIDPQHASRIFQMFQRLHSSADYPGTGIGLAVCRKIVERHGGRIWVDAEAQQGAVFRFTIPAVGSAPGFEVEGEAERI